MDNQYNQTKIQIPQNLCTDVLNKIHMTFGIHSHYMYHVDMIGKHVPPHNNLAQLHIYLLDNTHNVCLVCLESRNFLLNKCHNQK